MKSPIYQLVYASTRLPDVTDEDIVDGIVLKSIPKNATMDITGCIWFSNENFVQVLEGDASRVRHLYEKIETDDRHSNVTLVASAYVETRDFARFTMRSLGGAPISELTRLIDAVTPHLDLNRAAVTSLEPSRVRPGLITNAVRAMSSWVWPAEPPTVA